ncbi:unnamed protein product [Allacma fusca]|uniref:Peptidase S1 domain-containing protein n=1 Tax=Allacma fusca TaxID=39272 RepID=A0A8J2Q0T6_9HEXA|nr:unnamed protein product [Allacma fusca]
MSADSCSIFRLGKEFTVQEKFVILFPYIVVALFTILGILVAIFCTELHAYQFLHKSMRNPMTFMVLWLQELALEFMSGLASVIFFISSILFIENTKRSLDMRAEALRKLKPMDTIVPEQLILQCVTNQLLIQTFNEGYATALYVFKIVLLFVSISTGYVGIKLFSHNLAIAVFLMFASFYAAAGFAAGFGNAFALAEYTNIIKTELMLRLKFIDGRKTVWCKKRITAIAESNSGFCSGILLTSYLVLTAAHCFITTDESLVKVLVGKHSPENIRALIRHLIFHQEYDPYTMQHDIPLLELQTSVDAGVTIQFGHLPQSVVSKRLSEKGRNVMAPSHVAMGSVSLGILDMTAMTTAGTVPMRNQEGLPKRRNFRNVIFGVSKTKQHSRQSEGAEHVQVFNHNFDSKSGVVNQTNGDDVHFKFDASNYRCNYVVNVSFRDLNNQYKVPGTSSNVPDILQIRVLDMVYISPDLRWAHLMT